MQPQTADMTDRPQNPRRHLARRKKIAFALLTSIFVWAVIEGLAFIALHTSANDFEWADLRKKQQLIAQGAPTADEAQETIHPFQGWTLNPQVSQGVDFAGRQIPLNQFGLADDGPAIHKRGPQHLVVGVTGGSVAWQLSVAGEAAFKAKLAEMLDRKADEIKVVRLALSGYKQPQQLMTLSWLMTQGAEFDVVVNLDGFNEAVGAHDNRKAKVAMAYPTFWHARTRDIVDPRDAAFSMELFLLRGRRQEGARSALTSLWRWSPTYQLLWVWREERIRERRIDLGRQLVGDPTKVGRHGYASGGPAEDFKSNAEADQLAVQIWSNSSTQMASLCRGAGCVYLHCLQPNQYVPNSKPFSPRELKEFVSDDVEHGQIVRRLYPQFQKRGADLLASDVAFRDLTQLFATTSDTVYADYWCHFNELGNRMLAEAIALEVAELLADRRSK